MQRPGELIVIKRHASQRLYNVGAAAYVSLQDLARMAGQGKDFVVRDAPSGKDVIRSILAQIIPFIVRH
jgi:polyhydroxyalkanoate synthesis repressor PhaR